MPFRESNGPAGPIKRFKSRKVPKEKLVPWCLAGFAAAVALATAASIAVKALVGGSAL